MTKLEKISISADDKIALISNFSTMLTAGISILEVVDSLLEDSKGNQKKILQSLREDLIQGKHVHECFARFPKVFDNVTVNIIKASEEAGTLDITLRDLRQNIQKEMEFNDKVRSALIYPILIGVVFVGVLLVMLVFVIPKISSVFSRLRVELPLPTRVLIFVSDLLINNTIPFILGFIGIIAVLLLIYKKQKRILLNILFAMPIVSGLIKEIDLTRFTRSLYLLLSSGIPITSALDYSRDVVLRKDVGHMIDKTKEMVLSGKRISEGLRSSKGIVPGMMIKMIEAGEKTGSLDRAMQDISEFLDYQVSRSLSTLTALLEPIMLVVIGVAVGGMMLAIIAPIYSLIGQVGNR